MKPDELERGQAYFQQYCSACHQSDGSGESQAPPLAGSRWVAGPETALVRILLHGLRGPIEVAGEIYSLEMPGFGNVLSDEQAALLLTFVRQRWGAPSPAIKPETVARIRAATSSRNSYWTAEELQDH